MDSKGEVLLTIMASLAQQERPEPFTECKARHSVPLPAITANGTATPASTVSRRSFSAASAVNSTDAFIGTSEAASL